MPLEGKPAAAPSRRVASRRRPAVRSRRRAGRAAAVPAKTATVGPAPPITDTASYSDSSASASWCCDVGAEPAHVVDCSARRLLWFVSLLIKSSAWSYRLALSGFPLCRSARGLISGTSSRSSSTVLRAAASHTALQRPCRRRDQGGSVGARDSGQGDSVARGYALDPRRKSCRFRGATPATH